MLKGESDAQSHTKAAGFLTTPLGLERNEEWAGCDGSHL